MSILCLLDLSSTPSHRVFNQCLSQLDKDLSPHSARWFHALTSFRLRTLGIRVLKEPQPLWIQHRIKWTPLASIVDRRIIMLIVTPVDVNHPPQLQEHLQHQPAMEALPRPKLTRPLLKEGWTKWLWRKLKMPHAWCPVHLSSNLFRLNHYLLSFSFLFLRISGWNSY
jgi:hypothetical protein